MSLDQVFEIKNTYVKVNFYFNNVYMYVGKHIKQSIELRSIQI